MLALVPLRIDCELFNLYFAKCPKKFTSEKNAFDLAGSLFTRKLIFHSTTTKDYFLSLLLRFLPRFGTCYIKNTKAIKIEKSLTWSLFSITNIINFIAENMSFCCRYVFKRR